MVTPKISVIIPTHDRLPMLEEAVASVDQQTFAGWELIVVDDGSSDGTWEWLQQQSGIRRQRLETQQGPSAARNLGARHARGQLLAFLDSDDLFLPSKLERQLDLLDADPGLALCHSNETWLRDGKELRQQPKHEKRGGWIFEHCLPMCRVSPSAAVVRRNLFDDLGGFDEELLVAEDYELWLRLTCVHRVGFIDEPLVIKRGGHPGQQSVRFGRIEMFRVEALRRVLERATLTESQRRVALETLREKCEIVAQGCEKRGKNEEAARYRRLARPLLGAT